MPGAVAKRGNGALTKYDPEKGLNMIALAGAAEKRAAQAKDSTRLEGAIRAKLTLQAEFVFWWDTHVQKTNGARGDRRPNERRSRSATPRIEAGKNGIPERYVIDRWRRKLNDPDKFEAAFQQAVARYPKILEFQQVTHVAQNSGENEWYTPGEYIDAARDVLGAIDLDPASNRAANAVVKAKSYFSQQDDGLTKPWRGRVWMNPPYSQPLVQKFAEKLASAIRDSEVTAAIVLVNNATETEWFQAIAVVADALCFPRGRVRFWSPGKDAAAPLQGQALLYAGPSPDRFCIRFESFGLIARMVRS